MSGTSLFLAQWIQQDTVPCYHYSSWIACWTNAGAVVLEVKGPDMVPFSAPVKMYVMCVTVCAKYFISPTLLMPSISLGSCIMIMTMCCLVFS